MAEEEKKKATFKGRQAIKLNNFSVVRSEFEKDGSSFFSLSIEVPVEFIQASVVPEQARTEAQTSFLKYRTLALSQSDAETLLPFIVDYLETKKEDKKKK